MEEKYQKIINVLGKEKVRVNESMADHTTFKIGGPADLMVEVESEEELVGVLGVVRELDLPYFILGGGSNILVGDKGVRGIVIKIRNSKFDLACRLPAGRQGEAGIRKIGEKCLVSVGAGVPVSVLLNKLVENSVSDLEFMAGIPGTMGATVACNAGAWQKSLGETVIRVKVLTPNGEIKWFSKEKCEFDYRKSRFKGGKDIILEVELGLSIGNQEKIKKQIDENLEKRSCQPKEPSAGCVFINPKPLSAGALIEQCGLKGKKIGGAQISEKHANFFINIGGAKATDVVSLIDLAKSEVKNKFKIDLKEEILRIGQFI